MWEPESVASSIRHPMTPAEAQYHLTTIFGCTCAVYWWEDPPLAFPCELHGKGGGPLDDVKPPTRLDEARAVLAKADQDERARRQNEPHAFVGVEGPCKHCAAEREHPAHNG